MRQPGYAPKRAAWYAGFFFLLMLPACAAMGLLNVVSSVLYGQITGSGKFPAGGRTGILSPGFFCLCRN